MRDIHKFPEGFTFRTRKNHEFGFLIGILEKEINGKTIDYRWQILDDDDLEKENMKHALSWFERWERRHSDKKS